MRLRCAAVIGLSVMLVCSLGGCSGDHSVNVIYPSDSGFINGNATPCNGSHLTPRQLARVPVKVFITNVGKPYFSETTTGTHQFRFIVDPGTYILTSDQSGTAPVRVTLKVYTTVNVKLISMCS